MSKSQVTETRQEFRVSFIIQGIGLDFEAISRALKIAPTHTHRAGDLSKIKSPFAHDMWSLTSPLFEQEEAFDAHLKWLAEQLRPNYDFIKSLRSTAEVYIRCGYVTEREQSGFTLSSEALTIVTDLGISLDVSILSLHT